MHGMLQATCNPTLTLTLTLHDMARGRRHLRLLAYTVAPQRGHLALAAPPPVRKLLGRLLDLARQRHLPPGPTRVAGCTD